MIVYNGKTDRQQHTTTTTTTLRDREARRRETTVLRFLSARSKESFIQIYKLKKIQKKKQIAFIFRKKKEIKH